MHRKIHEFVKYIKLEKRYSPNTVEAYQTDLMQFEEFLKEYFHTVTVKWDLVSRRILRAYLGMLAARGLKRISVARKLAALRAYFAFLSRNGWLDINPALTLRTPKYDKRLPEFLSLEHMDQILEMPDPKTFEGCRDRAILELFYASGIRRAELIDLTVKDLYMDENVIRVIGKGEKHRIIPVGRHAKTCLTAYLQRRQRVVNQNVEQVFVLKSGAAMYPMAIYRIINKYLQKFTDIKKKSPHILRHTFATHLMNQGADIRAVKDLLGHASLSTTQIYTHTSIEHLKAIYNRAHPGGSDKYPKKKEV